MSNDIYQNIKTLLKDSTPISGCWQDGIKLEYCHSDYSKVTIHYTKNVVHITVDCKNENGNESLECICSGSYNVLLGEYVYRAYAKYNTPEHRFCNAILDNISKE